MSQTILQHLLVSSHIVEGTEGLYCKTHTVLPLSLKAGELADYNCHFNLFDIGIYRKYTICGNYYLRLKLIGEADITVQGHGESESTNVIHVIGDSSVPINMQSNMVGFSIKATTNCELIAADICCSSVEKKDIKMSLCICTFNNESLIKKKITKINDYFALIGEEKPSIIITDNGRTLSKIDGSTILPSNNLGGSGGFAKSIMCAMENGADYLIINDDDAVFEPEILYRVQSFLSLLKDDYNEIAIGGTMLDINHATTVVESGARIVSFDHIPQKKGLNMISMEDNLKLIDEEKSDYCGWWFYVIPRQTIEKYGCPLPLFLKNDDVEYGLRTKPDIIRMLGISVWHPSFSSKYSPTNYYYDIRNLLVTNIIHNDVNINEAITKILLEISAYRYLNAEAMIQGLEDFLKGPQYLFEHCKKGIKILKNENISDITELRKTINDKGIRKEGCFGFRKYSMNGLFLPSVSDAILPADCMHTEDFYRIKKILYTIDEEKGFITNKDKLRTIKDVIKVMRLKSSMKRKLPSLITSYKKSVDFYSSINGWKELFQ